MTNSTPLRPNLTSGAAFVTGAGSGIGAGLAERLAARGLDVTGFDRAADGLEATAERCQDAPGSFRALVGDVTSASELADAAAGIEGPISLVVANAGIALGGRFEDVPIDEWTRLLDINVVGVARTFTAFLPRLREQGKGWLVSMSSSAGLFPDGAFDTPYAASKAALLALSRSLAVQTRGDGIGMTVVCPRITDTPFPRSATAWTPKGPITTAKRDVSGADTVDQLLDATFESLEAGHFLCSTTPDTPARLRLFAEDPDAYLERVLAGELER